VVLPRFGVDALMSLVDGQDGPGPVFANRVGGWMSLNSLRHQLRAALPEHLTWATPHSFRRTVATVVRNAVGAELAQQQLSHAKLATTRRTICSGVPAALTCARCSTNMRAVNVSAESSGKVADSGRVARRAEIVCAGSVCAQRDLNPHSTGVKCPPPSTAFSCALVKNSSSRSDHSRGNRGSCAGQRTDVGVLMR